MRSLDQKGGVSNPGETDLPMFQLGKDRGSTMPMSTLSGKKGRQKHVRDEAVGTPFPGRGGFIIQRKVILGWGTQGGNRPAEMDCWKKIT